MARFSRIKEDYQAGGSASASDLNTRGRLLRGLSQQSGARTITGPFGYKSRRPLRPRPVDSIYIKLTGRANVAEGVVGLFTWVQVEFDPTIADYRLVSGGLNDDGKNYAMDRAAGRHALQPGVIVEAERSPFPFGPEGETYWLFDHPHDWLFVELIGEDSFGVNRWRYEWEERIFLSGAQQTPQAWTPLRSSDFLTMGQAVNTIEANNNGTLFEGHSVNVDGPDYPDGFSVMPASAGNPIVKLYQHRTHNQFGDTVLTIEDFTFEKVNADDGTCEP